MKASRNRRFPNSRPRRSHGPRGQVLVFVVMIMLVLLVVIMFLFDLQNIIRLRAKNQNGADAAALTAAAWQGRTLNLIGELNLLKAATVILTDLPPVPSDDPDDPEDELLGSVALLTQMQARLTYTGPLVGFAAAQQAAKNNGLRSLWSYSDFLAQHVRGYVDEATGGVYRAMYGDDPDGLGYAWLPPYQEMLEAIQNEGVAANPVNNRFLRGLPQLIGAGGSLLLDSGFYRAVHARHFCWFYRRGIGPGHGPIDLDGMVYESNPSAYFPGSEFLPLYVHFDSALSGAGRLARDEMMLDRGLLPLPDSQPGLSEIRWAVYDLVGDGNGWGQTGLYDFINPYLRSDVKPEFTYGGACARLTTASYPDLLLGRWTWQYGQSEDEETDTRLGTELAWSDQRFGSGGSFASEAKRLEDAEQRLASLRAGANVASVASAKPFGSLDGDVPHKAGVVLPVFTDVRLIPVGITPSNPLSEDPDFYQFIIEYFGHPAYPAVPDEIKEQYSYYLKAIEQYNDPASTFSTMWADYDDWRLEYMAGPDGIDGTVDDRRDPCLPASGGGGPGPGPGPGIIH